MLKPNHVLVETLEAYVLGKLQGEQLDTTEDHLLVCDRCRQSLAETESYVQAMRSAAARVRKDDLLFPAQPRSWWERLLKPVLAKPMFAVASAAVLGVMLFVPFWQQRMVVYQEVSLQATRGANAPMIATSQGRFRLKLDLQEIATSSSFHVTVVDGQGRPVWSSEVASSGTRQLPVEVPVKLSTGMYWVRLAESTGNHKLLREFPLQVP